MKPRWASLSLSLAALGCAGLGAPGRARVTEASSPMQDHPLVVRCRASAPACHAAAWAAFRGEGELAGDFAAAAFLVAGCDAGHAPSCADLAAALAAGRGVPRDDGRACELGLSEACARLSRSGPLVAAVPTAPLPAPLPPPEGFTAAAARRNEGDVKAYRGWAWTVHPEWHEALGLSREALERTPPATPGERALMNLAVAGRMAAVQRCLPAAFVPAPGAEGEQPRRTAGVAAFTVGEDGRAVSPAVRMLPGSVKPDSARAWWRCAEEAIARWVLPVPPSGGRFWLTFPGLGDEIVRTGPPERFEPVHATEGYTKPREREARCVLDGIQAPYGMEGYTSAPVTFQFAIGADGAPRFFSPVSPGVPPAVVEAVWRAVRGCAWVPARGPDGKAATVWVIMPVRFTGG